MKEFIKWRESNCNQRCFRSLINELREKSHIIRARKSAQKSRDKKKAEKAKENEPTLTNPLTELVAHTDVEQQVEPVEKQVELHTEVEKQVEPHTEVEKRVEKPIQKKPMEERSLFQRKKEEPKKRHIWFS